MTQHEPNRIPDDALEALARCLLPEIRSFFESEEGQREYAEWLLNKSGGAAGSPVGSPLDDHAQQGIKIKPHEKAKADEKLGLAG